MTTFAVVCVAIILTAPTLAADGRVAREDFDLYFSAEGSGKPIIFLSGGPGQSVEYMKEVGELLPPGFQRIFLEQRGTGRSQLPKLSPDNLSLGHYVEDLEALRQYLKLDRLLIVGHSWGGFLAMAYASSYPDKAERLVLIAPGGASPEYQQWFWDNIVSRLHTEDKEALAYWKKASDRGVDKNIAVSEMVRSYFPGYFYDRAKGLAYAAQLPDRFLNAAVAEIMIPALQRSLDLRKDLIRIKGPVLIIQGHQDPIGQKAVEEIHSLIKSSTLRYVPQCGHYPWVEQPEPIRAALTEFLTSK
jgi:proline iminopeptidase